MMKQLLCGMILMGLLLSLSGKELNLIRNGKVNAVLVCKKVKDKNLKASIEFFNDAVRRTCGEKFPVTEKIAGNKNNIQIVLVKRAMEKDDEFTIDFPRKNVMRITATQRSLFKAFAYILEKHFQCRFLFVANRNTPYREDINHYPKAGSISIPRKTVRQEASYNLRRQVDWRAVLWQERWGIKMELGASHMITYYAFPVYKYALDQSWPKNILPTLPNGKKVVLPKAKGPLSKNKYLAVRGYSANWNPCFTHKDTEKIAVANILEFLAKNPNENSVSLAVNDNGFMCQCKVCKNIVKDKRTQTRHMNYSEPYWKWVNAVANAVTTKYPNVYITALAYREVLEAPAYKLNKNVVPQLCFEITAMIDPEVYARRSKLLSSWSKVASNLTVWDYSYGMTRFLYPRIYFKSHTKLLRELYHKYNVRGIFVESDVSIPFEGPKHYLMSKILYDINADEEKILQDWLEHAVGKKSAPYLRAYYQFWEDYWSGREIRKTHWYKSRFSTYMMLGDIPSHALALQKGDMKKLRLLMEKMLAGTETPQQKKRAQVLMNLFELSECSASALFAEEMPSDGMLRTREEALRILKKLPEAIRAYRKLLKNPMIHLFPRAKAIPTAQQGIVGRIMPFLKDPEVKAHAVRISKDMSVPMEIRAMLKIWMGAKAKNLIVNGSFEEKAPLPRVRWNEGGAYRSAKRASHGDFSFRVPPFCCYSYRISVDPDKTYLFMFDAYIKQNSIEGNANYQLTTMSGIRHNQYVTHTGNKLEEGKWMTFSSVAKVGQIAWHRADEDYGIELMIYMRKFESDDEIYIDNVRAYCLDDLK